MKYRRTNGQTNEVLNDVLIRHPSCFTFAYKFPVLYL